MDGVNCIVAAKPPLSPPVPLEHFERHVEYCLREYATECLALVAPPPLPLPPLPTQGQRQRAAPSMMMPPPPVPIHRPKRRNPEPADEEDDEETKDYSVNRRLFQSIFVPADRPKGSAASSVLMPPPSAPIYRRCPADRPAIDFAKELHPKMRATFAMPPPPSKAPGTFCGFEAYWFSQLFFGS